MTLSEIVSLGDLRTVTYTLTGDVNESETVLVTVGETNREYLATSILLARAGSLATGAAMVSCAAPNPTVITKLICAVLAISESGTAVAAHKNRVATLDPRDDFTVIAFPRIW